MQLNASAVIEDFIAKARRALVLVLIVGSLPTLLAAAEPAPTPARLTPQTLSFMFENDLFGDSDAQYTNGLKLSWLSPDLKRLDGVVGLPRVLLSLVQGLNAFERQLIDDELRQFNIGFGLGQMMFTPDDTQAPALVVNDRPYAGWLYGSLTLVSKNDRTADTLELQAGMVGPASLAQSAQKFVHDIRDLPSPRGWDNQLDNEPGLVVYYERKWRLTRKRMSVGLAYDVIGHTGIALGNVADYLAAGAETRFGWNLPDDFGTSLIRPGGDANAPTVATRSAARSRMPGVYAFAAFGGRLVGRDLFLDGNTFSDSHDIDKKHLVGDLVIGASVIYRSVKISYAQVFRSKEFDGQRRRHKFGSLSVSLSF